MKEYFIGLDLGSNTIGWAVVDENNKLIKKKGKNLWGVRLFENANTSESRRLFRRSRRTINKRNWRLHLLRQELKNYCLKEDPDFFKKLKDGYKKETALFTGNYTDAKYFNEFPTISHLKVALMNPKKVDKYKTRGIYYRLLFLALNDILKTRGHFLSNINSSSFDKVSKEEIKELINNLAQDLNEHLEEKEEILIDNSILSALVEEFLDKGYIETRKQMKEALLIKAIKGDSVYLMKILSEDVKDNSFSFNEEDWEQKAILYEDFRLFYDKLFAIYSAIKINQIIGNHEYISQARVEIFEKHKKDLAKLKKDLRFIDEEYKRSDPSYLENSLFSYFFESNDDKNKSYSNYVGKLLIKKDKKRIKKGDSKRYINFISELKKVKERFNKDFPLHNDVLEDIEEEGYLNIPTNASNRLIPYQLHEKELNKILDVLASQENNQEEAKEISKRINQVLKFKVPYYVGTLNSYNSKNHWLVKKEGFENEKITPFNFDEAVDKEKTNDEFIKRMLRNCTYFINERCLPQESIAYQEYIFYNTVNTITINHTYLANEQKELIYRVLLKGKKITKKILLKTIGLDDLSDLAITGFSKTDEEKPLNISLSAVRKFKSIFGDLDTSLMRETYDEIVQSVGIIEIAEKDVRVNLVKKILNEKGVSLNEEQINKLSAISFTKWGNLSKKFLIEIPFYGFDGIQDSILNQLKSTNKNLVQILNSNTDNVMIIDAVNQRDFDLSKIENLHEYLKEKYISPQARRVIIQAHKIVDEIIKIMGGELPKHIAIEFTREDQKKEETKSRYQMLEKTFKNIQKEVKEDYRDIYEQLEKVKSDKRESELKSKALYLYFLQGGKDLYSGKPIDINDIYNKNLYDIDHIVPQSKRKEDNLNNLVLTRREMNTLKGDTYPVPSKWREDRAELWKGLKAAGLLHPTKYEKLTRDSPLTKSEMDDFIERQKTTLDWINLETANTFMIRYNKVNDSNFIIYSKSKVITEYRNNDKVGLPKFRELNNFHHAHDAYLNIVIGKKLLQFYSWKDRKTYNYMTYLENNLGDKDYMRKIFNYHDILMTKKTEINNKGALWDQMIVSKGSRLLPIKNDMSTDLYGGYNKASTAFFSVMKNSKNKIEIVAVPTFECKNFYDGEQFDKEKFISYYKEKGQEVIYPLIPVGSKVILDGYLLRIAGKSNNSLIYHNVTNILLSEENREYLKALMKISNKNKDKGIPKYSELLMYNIRKNNISAFKEIQEKILKDKSSTVHLFSNAIYNQILGKDRNEAIEVFNNLSSDEQANSLVLILKYLLKPFVSNRGKILFEAYTDFRSTSNITNSSFILIKESVTGFFTKKEVINSVPNGSNKKQ